MTYKALYEKGCSELKSAGIEEYQLDARLLLEYVCDTDRNYLLINGNMDVTNDQIERYIQFISKRSQRIPLQYITGTQNFMGLEFKVNQHVLIPRQDTEILVEEVMRELHDKMRILDMCTGSGCILISLLNYTNDCEGVGVDISEAALEVAHENADKVIPHENYKFIRSDLFDNVDGMFDFIVSNPPYIESRVIETLMPEVRVHEPIVALDGHEDGLFFYKRIIDESNKHLVSGGRLYFEIGYNQAAQVSAMMEAAGFRDVNVVKDYAQLDRVVYGTYIRHK